MGKIKIVDQLNFMRDSDRCELTLVYYLQVVPYIVGQHQH